jgi:hypothetical protein
MVGEVIVDVDQLATLIADVTPPSDLSLMPPISADRVPDVLL